MIYLVLSFILISFSYPIHSFNQPFITAAKKANPSVVSIVSEKIVENNFHPFFSPFPFDDNYQFDNYKTQSLGSGVIVDSINGIIITNHHVIKKSDNIRVILIDKTELKAEILGSDPLSDIAIIKIDSDKISNISIGNSDELQIGEWVIAIGSPFGLHLNHTVTSGIVSGIGRSDIISSLSFENFIQHDAAINPGNSGGALINLDGELVGINTAIATDGYSNSNAGVGFAIPINQAMRILDDIVSIGMVQRGWLGISMQNLDADMLPILNLDSINGVLVSEVANNSPAHKSGILAQDVITIINSKPITDGSRLKNIIASLYPGDEVRFTIMRNGKLKYISTTLGVRPDENQIQAQFTSSQSFNFDKIGLITENYIDKNSFFYENTIIVKNIKKSSPAYNKIHKGDFILEINKIPITNQDDYFRELSKYSTNDQIMLRVKTKDRIKYLVVNL
tara:strand:- start:116 stop:1468 length:1353 start_codon:yes stop_codon:yes gene_type:complete